MDKEFLYRNVKILNMYEQHKSALDIPRCTKLTLVAICLLISKLSHAAVTVYLDEAAYLAELASLYATVSEDFEDDATWGAVRSTISSLNTAPSIISNGILWSSNHVSGEITTANFSVHSGIWGFNAIPHGVFDRIDVDCTVPGNCGDGFVGTVAANGRFYGVGGWFKTNTPPAKLGLFVDGIAVDFGSTCDPTGQNCVNNDELKTIYKFYGVIDTAGFSAFEYREMEGTSSEQKSIFADTFTVATLDSDADGINDLIDAFPFDPTETHDTDGDGVGDNSDNCTLAYNPVQFDANNDGYGNACDADLTNNGITDTRDLSVFINQYVQQNPESDFTENGVVNTQDIQLFITMYGLPPGPSALVP